MLSAYMTDPLRCVVRLRCVVFLALGLAGGACRSVEEPEPARTRPAVAAAMGGVS